MMKVSLTLKTEKINCPVNKYGFLNGELKALTSQASCQVVSRCFEVINQFLGNRMYEAHFYYLLISFQDD